MRVERVLGPVPVEEVQALTRAAFAEQAALERPSGALSESPETVAADFAEHGGVLVRDAAGALIATCRLRRTGPVWAIRRAAVQPSQRRSGLGAALVEAVHAWAADEGVLCMHLGVRDSLTGSRSFWDRSGYRPLTSHGWWTELVRPLPVRLADVEATRALGRRLAAPLGPGDLVVLSGPLGAGKTTLTQGIAAGLGVEGRVTSPTFVLAREHAGPVPLVHADAYRLRESGAARLELDDLDLDAAVSDSVTVVEWGEGLAEGLADARLEVHLERPEGGDRVAVVTPYGRRWSVFAGEGLAASGHPGADSAAAPDEEPSCH